MTLRQVSGQGCTDSYSIGNDACWRDGARGGEIAPGGLGVCCHALLVWVDVGAEAVTAIVEGEDVESKLVQGLDGWIGVGARAVAAREKQDCG